MSTDDSWVFDSLVCFLHGPVWNAPLQTFVEDKSLVFDPNQELDENSPEIQKIHHEYKNLVDYMLGSFMEELQITPEQFEIACMEGRNQQKDQVFQFHQALFQQISAANDIKMFIRMMTQRNVELQLQALDLIEKNQLAHLHANVNDEAPTTNDRAVVKLQSVEELNEPPVTIANPEKVGDIELSDTFQRLNLFFEKSSEIDREEVQSRQEYLRQQRDKIIELKRQSRMKQLMDTVGGKSESTGASDGRVGTGYVAASRARPTSAQAAQRILTNGVNDELLLLQQTESVDVDAAVQLRKALAKRLRSEVVEQK